MFLSQREKGGSGIVRFPETTSAISQKTHFKFFFRGKTEEKIGKKGGEPRLSFKFTDTASRLLGPILRANPSIMERITAK